MKTINWLTLLLKENHGYANIVTKKHLTTSRSVRIARSTQFLMKRKEGGDQMFLPKRINSKNLAHGNVRNVVSIRNKNLQSACLVKRHGLPQKPMRRCQALQPVPLLHQRAIPFQVAPQCLERWCSQAHWQVAAPWRVSSFRNLRQAQAPLLSSSLDTIRTAHHPLLMLKATITAATHFLMALLRKTANKSHHLLHRREIKR